MDNKKTEESNGIQKKIKESSVLQGMIRFKKSHTPKEEGQWVVDRFVKGSRGRMAANIFIILAGLALIVLKFVLF